MAESRPRDGPPFLTTVVQTSVASEVVPQSLNSIGLTALSHCGLPRPSLPWHDRQPCS
jgi:hypothetical protein